MWLNEVVRSDRSGSTIKRYHNIRLTDQLVDIIENFKCLGFTVQQNARIMGDVASTIRCNQMKWR